MAYFSPDFDEQGLFGKRSVFLIYFNNLASKFTLQRKLQGIISDMK